MTKAGNAGSAPLAQPGHEQLVDLAFAVTAAVVVIASVVMDDPSVAYDFPAPDAVLVLLLLVASLPLAMRRRRPFAVLLVSTGATCLVAALGWNTGLVPACPTIALYSVAAWGSWRTARNGLLVVYAGEGGLALLRAPFHDHPIALLGLAVFTVAWLFGLHMRRKRAATDRAVARATAAEHRRVVAAERAVLTERLRIAGELHDVVSHTLSVIAVQSATARHELARSSGHAAATLSVIAAASRNALDDLRRMLGMLRTEPLTTRTQSAMPTGSAVLTPAGGVARDAVVDALLAGALAVLVVSAGFLPDPTEANIFREPDAWSVALGLVASLPLAMRRQRPLAVFFVTTSAATTLAALGWHNDWPFVCIIVALYTVAVRRTWPILMACLLFGYAGIGLLAMMRTPHFDTPIDVVQPFELLAVAIGRVVRRWRRDQVAAVERQLEAERTRVVLAERAVVAERLRVARELHDVVSHTLTVIAVQSGIALHQLATHPERAGPALTVIEDASHTALDDLRRMLDVLHDGHQLYAHLAPSPGLAELELLVSAHRATHGPVKLDIDRAVESAPTSLRLTAFRLVQEALTNVGKHAPGAAAYVSVSTVDDRVIVQIDNDNTAQPARPGPTGHGYGLVGMRERATLFDGTLTAGPRPGGGFRVRAILQPVIHTSEATR
jgi:signal transduction histidine kinase